MSDQLSPNEHWNGNKKTGLDLNIVKKGKPAWDAMSRSNKVEDQHRQPRD
jgi:hypothetical protein